MDECKEDKELKDKIAKEFIEKKVDELRKVKGFYAEITGRR